MADAKKSIERTLRHEDAKLEGKVTKDTGGLTRWGISQKAYPGLDIKNLPLDMAIRIYDKDYFTRMELKAIKDQEVADNIFDFGVNAGTTRSINMAVETAAEVIGHSNIPDMMKITDFINKADPKKFTKVFVEKRKKYYINLVEKNKNKYGIYLKGWLNRAESFLPKE